MDNTAVEKDLRCVGDAIEASESFLELIIVVMRQRLDPCLDLLLSYILAMPLGCLDGPTDLLQRHG